jgi:transcriptional regulator with XRE-family HTH domain
MGDLLGQLDDLVSDKTSEAEYQHELAISGFTNDVARVMNEKGVSQSELARRLGVSRARVSQLMRHTSSPTLRTMVEVANALGCEVGLGVTPRGSRPSGLLDPEAQRTADDEVLARRS